MFTAHFNKYGRVLNATGVKVDEFGLPESFAPVREEILRFITARKYTGWQGQSLAQVEQINGISNRDLASRIVKASFCFGTDSHIFTALLSKESRFTQNAVSHTGAVGLTQMTSIGLDEVNDQTGSRGGRLAPAENAPAFLALAKCYSPNFKTMHHDNPAFKGKLIGNTAMRVAAKSWLIGAGAASVTASAKQMNSLKIDRQLIYGKMLFKTKLSVGKARAAADIASKYNQALQSYNGDDVKLAYAKAILSRRNEI